MRTPLIAGNWKMNNTRVEARALISALIPQIDGAKGAEALVIPPFTALDATGAAIGSANIALGAQGVFWEEKGAWTTQVSADMLLELGCKYALMGHSETRGRFGKVDDTLTSRLHYFGETDKTINAKAKFVLAKGLTPIICCGEMIDERKAGKTDAVISGQTKTCPGGLTAEQGGGLVIAAEPVWAIGTGETCDAEEANRVCGMIRKTVADSFGAAAAEKVRILYGGSMNEKNCAELLAKPDIDGGLIGGAALKADKFSVIVNTAAGK